MLTVNRLLVVAGPSCSGKSTFIERFCAGELPEVAAKLRLGEPSAWLCLLPKDVSSFEDETMEQAILHYDFLRPWTGGQTADYSAEVTVQLAASAAEVKLVTLRVPAEELHRRMAERRSTFIAALLRGRPWDSESLRTRKRSSGPPPDRRRSLRKTWAIVRELRRLGEKVRSYRRRDEVEALYDAWISFWAARPAEHWILDGLSDPSDPVLLPASEWRDR